MPLRTSLYTKPTSGRWASKISKRREVLSVNTISLPLADFRHISHIGSNRDSFGDLSFLKMDHGLLLQSSQSEQNLFMACSPPPKPPRLNLDEAEGSESPDWHVNRQNDMSQTRQKCSSMPLLDNDEGDGEMELEDGYQRGNNVASRESHRIGWDSSSSDQNDSTDTSAKNAGQQKDEDSGFSFSLDLGPSILDDVLQVMDKLHN